MFHLNHHIEKTKIVMKPNFLFLPGKRGRLLSLPERQQTQLQNFLQQDEFGYLKWLHDIECRDFKSVSLTFQFGTVLQIYMLNWRGY